MAVKKIALSWVTVADIEKAKAFFHDKCGLEVTGGSAPEYGWLELVGKEGGMTLGVGKANADCQGKAGVNAVVTMLVDDIVKTKKEMEAKGVVFIGDIMEVPGHVKMATFVDPDNNTFQLVEEIEKGSSCC